MHTRVSNSTTNHPPDSTCADPPAAPAPNDGPVTLSCCSSYVLTASQLRSVPPQHAAARNQDHARRTRRERDVTPGSVAIAFLGGAKGAGAVSANAQDGSAGHAGAKTSFGSGKRRVVENADAIPAPRSVMDALAVTWGTR